jgi:hypothetical protein
MAQDVRDVRVQPPDASLHRDDALTEKSSVAEWSPAPLKHFPGGHNSDNPPMEASRAESTDQTAGSPQITGDVVAENAGPSQAWGRKLRTLPGKQVPLGVHET